jgi:hypothetical protein
VLNSKFVIGTGSGNCIGLRHEPDDVIIDIGGSPSQASLPLALRCRGGAGGGQITGRTRLTSSSDQQKHRPLPLIGEGRPCRDLFVGRTPFLDVRKREPQLQQKIEVRR